MGFIEKLLRPTPFYKTYKNFLRKKNDAEQERSEKALHPARVKFYRQFVSAGDIVFDVGANVGNRVAAFLECGARVVAVEPQPQCVNLLNTKFGDSILVENIGLGEKQGELEMQIATDSTVSSFNQDYIAKTRERFKYTAWVDKIKVQILTLDDVIAKHGLPKFCKIDVEGYELEVLNGLNQSIPYISLEYCVPEMQVQLLACVDRLNAIGSKGLFNYSVGESMQWALSAWMDYESFKGHLQSDEFLATSFGDIYFQTLTLTSN